MVDIHRDQLPVQQRGRVPATDSGAGCAGRDFGPLLYDNSVPCISEIHSEFSDSIHFMQFHTEFQYDPAQDRRAEQVSNGSSS